MMGPIHTSVSDELSDQVRGIAKARGWTIAKVVAEALEEWLQNQTKARVDPCDWSAAMSIDIDIDERGDETFAISRR